jgi:hypothetical protein
MEQTPTTTEEVKKETTPTSFMRMMRVNALTGILSDKAFVSLVKDRPEGEYLLDVFAKAIETELESMFQGDTKTKESISVLLRSIDTAYAKMQAMAASPIQAVLDRLCTNLGGSEAAEPRARQDAYNHSYNHQAYDGATRRGEGVSGF